MYSILRSQIIIKKPGNTQLFYSIASLRTII
jgi:hypothetical protein